MEVKTTCSIEISERQCELKSQVWADKEVGQCALESQVDQCVLKSENSVEWSLRKDKVDWSLSRVWTGELM